MVGEADLGVGEGGVGGRRRRGEGHDFGLGLWGMRKVAKWGEEVQGKSLSVR